MCTQYTLDITYTSNGEIKTIILNISANSKRFISQCSMRMDWKEKKKQFYQFIFIRDVIKMRNWPFKSVLAVVPGRIISFSPMMITFVSVFRNGLCRKPLYRWALTDDMVGKKKKSRVGTFLHYSYDLHAL